MASNTRSINVNAGPGRSASRSFARVFDTYTAPAQSRSGLHSLGAALGLVGDSFQSAENRRRQEEKDELERGDKRRGMLAGLSLSLVEDPAKIKSGEMYPQESEAFMAGVNQSQAQAWAYETLRTWNTEYESWQDRDSNNPALFQTFMSDLLGKARSSIGDNEFAIAGALPVLQQGVNNLSTKHTAYTADRVKTDDIKSMQSVALGLMENHDWDADPTGGDLIAGIAFQTDLRVARGLDGTLINQTMVDDVLNYADAFNDTRFLAALARAHDAGTYRLSAAQMKQVDDMRLNIETEIDAVAADNAAAEVKAVKEAKNTALNDYHAALLEDRMLLPSKDLPEDVYRSALALRSAYNQALNTVDPDAEAVAFARLNSVIYEPEFQKLPYHEKVAQIAPMLADPAMSLSEGSIAGLFRVLGAKSDPKSSFNNPVIIKLRGNAVSAVKTLGGGIISMGNENQLGVAFQSAYDNEVLRYDLEGKSPAEIRSIHDGIVKQTMLDMLAHQETRLLLLASLEDNPELARQFGIADYTDQYYSDNPAQKASDELELITSSGG